MNAALIELLKTLQQAGSMDVLSPMFKDMGENGSRAISALSTLAGHIDEVVAQQEEANTAFKEATSIGKEYDVQNNTVQASLDKAKARVHELAVELGEKLQPVMRFCISSSTVFLKVLSSLVDFVIANQRAIIAVSVALTAYNVVMLVHNARMTAATRLTVLYNGALNLLKRLLPAVRLLFTPLINAVQYFTNGLQVNYTMQERWRKSMAAMNFSSWTGLILTLGTAIYMLVDKWRSAKEEAERVRKEQEEYKRSLTDLDSTASQYCASELARLDSLYKAATNNAKSTDERKKAAERMQSLYPAYFKNLSTELIMVGQASRAYKELRDSIIQAARARAAASKIEENEKQLLDLEAEQEKLKKKMDDDARKVNATRGSYNRAERRNSTVAMLNNQNFVANEDVGTALNAFHKAVSDYERSSREYWNNVNTQRQIHNANQYLSDKYSKAAGFQNQQDPGIPTIPAGGGGAVSGGGGGGGRGKGGSGGGGSSASQDRFAKEREWREREEASARISWRTGETDYLAYTKRMDEIAVEFYEKQLEHTDLSETEKLKIIADWRDAQYKQQETLDNQTVEREEKHYNLRLSTLKQYYIDGTISKETYEEKVEEAEIEHQKRLVDIYKAGSKEQLQASQRLKDLLLQQMEKRQQETQKLQEQMAAMQKEYFGEDPNEQSKKMFVELIQLKKIYDNLLAQAGDNEKRRLDIVEAYEKAVLLIRKKYGMEGGKASANGLINALEKANEWMKSEAAQKFAGAMSTVVSGMSAIFSQLNTGIQADLQIQTAEINKRYDAELSRAEGNSYKVRKLEKDKEKELAKAKNEANRKMFAMQVIQAVSQTYQNALSAYGAALKVGGMAGIILAPIAAAMAMAAGMMQVANIKKQQQASEAQGYAEGGFTPKGRRDEAVGVVHAGEWVASQKLVNNPRTRPLLEALDYAQRTNTIGSTAADVSRSITAPMLLASQPAAQPVVVQPAMPTVVVEQNGEYAATMRRLADRLNQPFVTINTVTGEYGSLKADEDYARLMKNKSPKSRKS